MLRRLLPRPRKQYLSDEEIAALVAGGRQLMVAGDIPNARLVLQQAAEADNATAALELGATYDPTFLQQLKASPRGGVASLEKRREVSPPKPPPPVAMTKWATSEWQGSGMGRRRTLARRRPRCGLKG